MVNNAYQTSSRYLLKKGLTMQSYLLTLRPRALVHTMQLFRGLVEFHCYQVQLAGRANWLDHIHSIFWK
jgi:hypothetical protein